jgi:hypothetical protein
MRPRLKMYLTTGATLAVLLVVGVAIASCTDARANETAQSEDLKRDLELATTATVALAGPKVDGRLLSSLETKPLAAPQPATTLRRSSGPRAIHSRTPTVRSAPDTEAPAEEEGALSDLADAPVPEISEPVAVAPRPIEPVVSTGTPAGDYGGGGVFGGGVYGGGSGRGGSVIRGGGVDGDNCELHRRGRGTTRGPVYVPTTVVTYPTASSPAVQPRGTGISIGSRNPGVARRTVRTSPTSSTSPVSPRSRPSRRGI